MRDNLTTDHLHSISKVYSDAPNSVMANAYYSGKLGPWGIDANIDYYTQREKKDDIVDEESLSDTKHVESVSENKNHLLASRLVVERKVWGGSLKLGGELSFLSRDNLYGISGVESVSGRQSEVSEQNYAAFAEYGLMIPKAGMLTLGMRYEHVAFDFDDHTDAARSISRSIDNVFPSLSFATRIGLLQMQLSYAVKTRRPSYYDLRSEVEYVSRYTLQTGNTTLKNETRDMTVSERLAGSYRNSWLEIELNGSFDYRHSKNKLQPASNLNTWQFSYGGNISLTAPWGTTLATDLNMNSRRGYSDKSLNTNELVWNAQLSQGFLKGKPLVVMLQFYDILQKQSNLSRSITASMRSDTEYNAINSYVMLHVNYRFNLFGTKEARRGMRGRDGYGGPGMGPGMGPGGGRPPRDGGGGPGRPRG